jgi:hypothetical protein
MKAKVDAFVPTNFCKRTGLCPMNQDVNIELKTERFFSCLILVSNRW